MIVFTSISAQCLIATTGRDYQQDYVMRMETQDGKIVHYREYWNLTPILESWGNTQNLNQS